MNHSINDGQNNWNDRWSRSGTSSQDRVLVNVRVAFSGSELRHHRINHWSTICGLLDDIVNIPFTMRSASRSGGWERDVKVGQFRTDPFVYTACLSFGQMFKPIGTLETERSCLDTPFSELRTSKGGDIIRETQHLLCTGHPFHWRITHRQVTAPQLPGGRPDAGSTQASPCRDRLSLFAPICVP